MAKYIDADKLIAEIERRLQENADKAIVFGAAFAGRTAEDNDLKNLVTSLQQEQPEVDLEKEFAHEYAIYHLPTFILASLDEGTELIHFIYKTARHFYKLGLNARKEE